MSSIYIHIPFCKTRCIYCDFFSQTGMAEKGSYIKAICKELEIRKDYLNNSLIQTIYFGGGTPSQLDKDDFVEIFDTINKNYIIGPNPEITIEANPDDLTPSYIAELTELPFNRISIGIQSFDDNELKFMQRRHTAAQAKSAIKDCQNSGFSNISIDLIYGLPGQSLNTWISNIEQAISLNTQHISAYHLIYEEDTKLYKLLQTKKVEQVKEDLSIEMFSIMKEMFEHAGFIHYEISNFAREGFISRHNSSYWSGVNYLGIGSAAHSFDGKSRSWNVASIRDYIKGIDSGATTTQTEILDIQMQYNDFILTGMRTMWGLDLEILEILFGKKMLDYCIQNASQHIKNGYIEFGENKLKISNKGLLISDGIMSDLMYVD